MDVMETHKSRMHPVQLRIFREMSPERKLEIAQMLYYSARELKAAAIRAKHPEWSEEEIQSRLSEAFLYGRT
ncbi:MAG: hypothetical protein K9N21_17115 [Deltaproteobacteria bacterium]|nr:hypothetical protein [Deltaproteobacteria bacterium]